ncbi:M20 family metallopeptidase [Sporomusa sp.]|uniref:M20 metallopeptidase family protein n=1 Tax=Sporomusa sp. TaxID=2078658 RepID=UPI002C57A1C1|nr:M20 family metallopeptidase [Sporomusa sp.]HWR08032.1 M20 family metallopeptidase [Sporomusa sp.]
MKTILEQATELSEQLIDIRRDLHRNPELSFKEYRTTEYITQILLLAGIEVVPWGGETGVVGLLKGDQPGPVVALRADIDGLPVTEENNCLYQSLQPGVMHACGHDAHTACLLGAALILAGRRASLAGTVKFIFQPAEEINAGAKLMLEQGVLTNPAVDVIFGLHNTPTLPVGQIGCKEGPLMAAVDTTFLTIKGTGGHGAIPHSTRDPITAVAAVIQGLQTIVSRQVDPLAAAVISFGTINGGHAHNVIPDKVELTGTVRTFDAVLRREMPGRMQGLISGIAQAMGTQAEFVYRQDLPAVFNPPGLAAWCRQRLEQVVGTTGVVTPVPSMGGEDFALFQEQIPGVFLWLGVGNPAKGIVHQWHNPCFDIDEDALKFGAAALAQLAYDYLGGVGR